MSIVPETLFEILTRHPHAWRRRDDTDYADSYEGIYKCPIRIAVIEIMWISRARYLWKLAQSVHSFRHTYEEFVDSDYLPGNSVGLISLENTNRWTQVSLILETPVISLR